MELIKRHKGLAIVGTLALVLLIIIFAIFGRMIFSSKDSRYKDVAKIDKSITEKVISETEEISGIESVIIRQQEKTIYTTITLSSDAASKSAKEVASKTLEYYDEEDLEYFDFEYILTWPADEEDEDKETYTIFGKKHPDMDSISWTKN